MWQHSTCDVAAEHIIAVDQGAAPAVHRQDLTHRIAAILLLRRRGTKRWPMPAHASTAVSKILSLAGRSRQRWQPGEDISIGVGIAKAHEA